MYGGLIAVLHYGSQGSPLVIGSPILTELNTEILLETGTNHLEFE